MSSPNTEKPGWFDRWVNTFLPGFAEKKAELKKIRARKWIFRIAAVLAAAAVYWYWSALTVEPTSEPPAAQVAITAVQEPHAATPNHEIPHHEPITAGDLVENFAAQMARDHLDFEENPRMAQFAQWITDVAFNTVMDEAKHDPVDVFNRINKFLQIAWHHIDGTIVGDLLDNFLKIIVSFIAALGAFILILYIMWKWIVINVFAGIFRARMEKEAKREGSQHLPIPPQGDLMFGLNFKHYLRLPFPRATRAQMYDFMLARIKYYFLTAETELSEADYAAFMTIAEGELSVHEALSEFRTALIHRQFYVTVLDRVRDIQNREIRALEDQIDDCDNWWQLQKLKWRLRGVIKRYNTPWYHPRKGGSPSRMRKLVKFMRTYETAPAEAQAQMISEAVSIFTVKELMTGYDRYEKRIIERFGTLADELATLQLQVNLRLKKRIAKLDPERPDDSIALQQQAAAATRQVALLEELLKRLPAAPAT